MDVSFNFDAELYRAKDHNGMVFVDVPLEIGEEIHDMPLSVAGFGSVKVEVCVGATSWSTSVFPSRQSGSFVLPVKKAVRDAEAVDVGDTATFELTVQLG